MTEDLWGDLPEPTREPHPRQILEDQAHLLTKKSGGLLVGRLVLDTQGRTCHKEVAAELFVDCPAMGNYSYGILEAEYNVVDPFPAYVIPSGESLMQDAKPCRSAEDFIAAVRDILRSKRVQRAIASLLREAQGDDIPF